jgi:hypothetical protein
MKVPAKRYGEAYGYAIHRHFSLVQFTLIALRNYYVTNK